VVLASDVCPENAIHDSFQINLEQCQDHRACVNACGSIGAIQFNQVGQQTSEEFDFILDLHQSPFLQIPELPKGYFARDHNFFPSIKPYKNCSNLLASLKSHDFLNIKKNCALMDVMVKRDVPIVSIFALLKRFPPLLMPVRVKWLLTLIYVWGVVLVLLLAPLER
jgi:hypothetical protein